MQEFHITTQSLQADNLSDQLTLLGAVSVTWQDAANQPIYEPLPDEWIVWPDTVLIALFEETEQLDVIDAYLQRQQEQRLLCSFKRITVPEKDWVRLSLDQFKPTLFGKRLWICPSWHEPPEPKAVNVMIDPGWAFGTGSHPTTALCLEWLDSHIKGDETVIDFGCGSGILAVAALKLGAKSVIGIDHDRQALSASLINAEQNQVVSSMTAVLPTDLQTDPVDLILANILAKPLITLAPLFTDLLKPKGRLLLSGLMKTQVDSVLKAYKNIFEVLAITTKEEWACISLKKLS